MFYDYPIFFERNRVYRVYKGGKLFSGLFGDEPEDGNYPEEWIASDVHAVQEKSAGPHEGVSKIKGEDLYLDEAIEKYKTEIIGNRSEWGILTKALDSAIRLPMQAHPDKAFSKKYFNSNHGKEESWIVLDTRPGAKVFYEFKDGVTIDEFSAAIDKSENDAGVMETLVKSMPVKKGDVIFIPGKMVHAIGAGCLMLEVQEPSDWTVQPERWCGDHRLTDKEMTLGLDRQTALKCFDVNMRYPHPQKPITEKNEDGVLYESLIDERNTKEFIVHRITLKDGKYDMNLPGSVYIVIEGEAEITGDGYEKEVEKGDYFVISAAAEGKYSISGNAQIIECWKK